MKKFRDKIKSRGNVLLTGLLILCVASPSASVSAASAGKEEPGISQQISEVHMPGQKNEQETEDQLKEDILVPPIRKEDKDCTMMSNGYYSAPYYFDLCWTSFSIEDKGLVGLFRYDASNYVQIKISDKKSIKVYWADSCAANRKDEDVIDSLKQLLIRMNDVFEEADKSFKEIMVSDVINSSDRSLEELEEEFYEEDDNKFHLLFPLLKEKEQKKYLKKMMEEDNHYYSSCLRSASAEMADYCAGLAYEKRDLSQFIPAAEHLTKEAKAAWIKRCKKDKAYSFEGVLKY